MRQLFVLSKENVELAKEEVLALYKPKKYATCDNLLMLESNKDFSKRIAYTHFIHEVIFNTTLTKFEKDFKEFNWQKVYTESFALRSQVSSINEKYYAKYVWQKLKRPKVDLKNPGIEIHIIQFNETILVCKLVRSVDKSFFKRKPHLNPAPHPTGINPKLAIACINLTGKTQGILTDPFCGAGGILIEAGLLGYKTSGYDISEEMLMRAKINLNFYKIKNYQLKPGDATKIKKKVNLVVTDLPYGKNSLLKQDLSILAKSFFKNLYLMTDVAVILLPDFLEHKKIIGKFKVKHEFNYYFHKSLSRKILVLGK